MTGSLVARRPVRSRAADPLRLLLVDDSVVARAAIGALLTARGGFEIVAAAAGVAEAQAVLARQRVDVILLDLHMPGRGGLDALPDLVAAGCGARVLIVSSSTSDGGEAAVRALTLGAADTICKPAAGELGARFAEGLAERLLRIGQKGAVAAPAGGSVTASHSLSATPVGCVAIGASTGGLAALTPLLAALPARFAAPILVTQHLPAEFMPFFVAQLSGISRRPARLARDGERLRAGEVLVAPGDAHLSLASVGGTAVVRLEHGAAPSGCRPSVDPMLQGVAALFGRSAVGIVLSGMGRDGALGAERLAAAGGEVIAQDAGSSAIWGMPGAVARAGLAAAVLPPAAIAAHLISRGSAAAWS